MVAGVAAGEGEGGHVPLWEGRRGGMDGVAFGGG